MDNNEEDQRDVQFPDTDREHHTPDVERPAEPAELTRQPPDEDDIAGLGPGWVPV